MPRGSCDGDTFSAEAPSSEESLVCFRLSEPAQGAFYSAQRFRELSCLDGVGSDQWQPSGGSVCVYIQCCWHTSLLCAYTESALCFRLEFLIEWAVLCVCPVELLEEPAPLTASGDEAGPSRLLDWTPWYCALEHLCSLSLLPRVRWCVKGPSSFISSSVYFGLFL